MILRLIERAGDRGWPDVRLRTGRLSGFVSLMTFSVSGFRRNLKGKTGTYNFGGCSLITPKLSIL